MALPAKRRKQKKFKAESHRLCAETYQQSFPRHHGVTGIMVQNWRAIEDKLKNKPRTKCALRRETPHWPALENHVGDMVYEHCHKDYLVTWNNIHVFAIQCANFNPAKDLRPLHPGVQGSWKGIIWYLGKNPKIHKKKFKGKVKVKTKKLWADLNSKLSNFHQYVL